MSKSKNKVVHQYRELLKENCSFEEIEQSIFDKFYHKWHQRRQQKKIGYLFFLISFCCFAFIFIPLTFVFIKQIFSEDKLFNPLPDEEVLQFSSYRPKNEVADSFLPVRGEVRVIEEQLDYLKLSSWFSNQESMAFEVKDADQTEYVLEIPKLNIYQAKVKVGGENLSQNLVQYTDTPGPGEYGAPIIFGHSSLRQFYNPDVKNSGRYTSLFSTIMTLEKDDKIFLIKNGVRYTYKVTFKENIKPDDRYILSQRYDLKYLKLVTCTPEGTFLMRGIVSAQLVGSKSE